VPTEKKPGPVPFTRRLRAPGGRSLLSILLLALLFFPVSYPGSKAPSAGGRILPAFYGFQVIQTFPHDPEAFTQGLIFHEGYLYESTGLQGKSSLRKIRLETGQAVKIIPLSERHFGEGLTRWKDRLVQLTWQSRIGFIYDLPTLRLMKTRPYPFEGWGLTEDGHSLIASDGTAQLYFLDPVLLTERKRIVVRDQGLPVARLNELEFIQGEIFANIFLTDRIARIAPDTGEVTGWIDLTGLLPSQDRRPNTDVLNGIAYDRQKDRLLVTGKNWPKLFHIRLVKRNPGSP
jgi:glutaminyl-peptide cyclotransferase